VFGLDAGGQRTNNDLTTYKPAEIKQTGGECVNCHMPQTVYMQRHSRHDHGFTIPDPLLNKQWGITNACNRCHTDKDLDWSIQWSQKWYGDKMERPSRQRAQIVAGARKGDPAARAGLLTVLAKEESPFWRAVAAGLLGGWVGDRAVAKALSDALKDTNSLVRVASIGALDPLGAVSPPVEDLIRMRLDDPALEVRIAAAWAMRTTLSLETKAARELLRSMALNAGQPTGQLLLGQFHFARHDNEQALAHFEKAVAWDPDSPPFRQNLAIVLSAMNRPQEALHHLIEACRIAPQDADAHYLLGLAFSEMHDVPRAAASLAEAVKLQPRHARAWYNLGLAQNGLGDSAKALESLLRAEAIAPNDARVPYARATILAALGRRAEALAAADRALEISPGFQDAQNLVIKLRDQR
jgi:tetratricopeptide (TPR) repeat protein